MGKNTRAQQAYGHTFSLLLVVVLAFVALTSSAAGMLLIHTSVGDIIDVKYGAVGIAEATEVLESMKLVEDVGAVRMEPMAGAVAQELPGQAVKAVQPVQPVQQLKEVQPVEAVQPVNVVQSVQAVQPVNVVQSVQAVQPVKAVQPVEAMTGPTVYLTFDDGPSPLTGEVLDILQASGVPATFFVLGEAAERRPDLVKRMVREGHAVGNHTYNHRYEELYTDPATFWQQVEQTEHVLTGLIGERTRLFRAPGGTHRNLDADYFSYLAAAGYTVFDWNVDAGDSRRRGVPADEIIRNVMETKLSREMNVLLHDSAGHEETLKALPDIIAYFKEAGYRFAVLTPDTKPITFRISESKWKRSWSRSAHEALLARIHASTLEASGRSGASPPSGTGAEVKVGDVKVAEEVKVGDVKVAEEVKVADVKVAKVKVAEKAKVVVHGEGWLGLREWVRQQEANVVVQAHVRWHEVRGEAELQVGALRFVLKPATGEVVQVQQDGSRESVMLDFQLVNNQIQIQPVQLVALLG